MMKNNANTLKYKPIRGIAIIAIMVHCFVFISGEIACKFLIVG